MKFFRAIFLASLLTGLLSGAAIGLMHFSLTTPIILAAEHFEQGEIDSGESHEWAPADGMERTLYTFAADFLVAIGFACLLIVGMVLLNRPLSLKQGALIGFCFFAALSLAPSFGLPPELPGTEAGPLVARQIWWLGTAIVTLVGLALILVKRKPLFVVFGLALLVAPHVIGAPIVENPSSTAPLELQHQFHILTLAVSFVFWLIAGISGSYFSKKFLFDNQSHHASV